MSLPVIVRPNGKPYRPRKLEATSAWVDDELAAIYVFGFHDAAIARPWAEALVAELNSATVEVFGPGAYIHELAEPPTLDWIGTSPGWDSESDRMTRCFKPDPDRGRAAVVWKVREFEHVPTSGDRPDGIMPPPLDGLEP
jgi:hypothetical protein